jgi:hypothetical protein
VRLRKQLKLRLAATASAVALVAGLGVAFAGPAAAKDEQALCAFATTHTTLCAFNWDGPGQTVSAVGPPGGYWDVPGVSGQISSDLTNPDGGTAHLCMELDASDHDYIVMASCQGKAAEEWAAEAGNEAGTTVYVNGYDASLCLNVYPYGDYPQMIGYTCDTSSANQELYPYLDPPS